MLTLDDLELTGIDEQEQERILLVVNAYITNKGVKVPKPTPKAIKQAGQELANAFLDGELYQGRDEGIVTSKSATAGEVSVSKTYAQGELGQAKSSSLMVADALLEPYIIKSHGVNVMLGRI